MFQGPCVPLFMPMTTTKYDASMVDITWVIRKIRNDYTVIRNFKDNYISLSTIKSAWQEIDVVAKDVINQSGKTITNSTRMTHISKFLNVSHIPHPKHLRKAKTSGVGFGKIKYYSKHLLFRTT